MCVRRGPPATPPPPPWRPGPRRPPRATPTRAGPAVARASRSRQEVRLKRAHLLVVDDEELYRRSLERVLARAGHQVTTARDAGEAMALVASQPFELVLCDVKMPGINGHELVRQIREVDPDLPCIVVTGYGSA